MAKVYAEGLQEPEGGREGIAGERE